MKTSSRSNPQPGTFVNVGTRTVDIVFVSRYRVRRNGGRWCVYVQREDKWSPLSRPQRFDTKRQAFDAISEHMRSEQVDLRTAGETLVHEARNALLVEDIERTQRAITTFARVLSSVVSADAKPSDQTDVHRRLVALETWRDAVEDDLAQLREQCGFPTASPETTE